MNGRKISDDLQKKRGSLLLVTHRINAGGGGNCVSAWALQALCEEWDVTLLCETTPDIESVNHYYGTQLDQGCFKTRTLPWLLRMTGKLDTHSQSIWPLAWLIRTCHRIGGDFDLLISVANEVDLGHRSIQYTHYPIYARRMPMIRKYAGTSPWNQLRGLLRGEYRPWMIFTETDPGRIEKNLFLANSRWTARLIQSHYAVDPQVLYPPVRIAESTLPWDSRKPAFAILGRLSALKRQCLAIDLLEKVRERGHAVDLHIIGDPDPNDHGAYASHIQQRAWEAGDWAQVHMSVTRQELDSIVGRCRFGLHLREEEHFGIAIAEMMSFGCIVFVPNGGGQVEIVGRDSGLVFESIDDAVNRICHLLDDDSLQIAMSTRQQERALRFSTDKFMARLQKIAVDELHSANNRTDIVNQSEDGL